MELIEEIFESLPSMKIVDGIAYYPIVKKDCDGYYMAYYLSDHEGRFIYSDGTGYGSVECALKKLYERIQL